MIKVSNLHKKFDQTTVLKDISFEVKKGEIVGFLGKNGVGKTTTMRLIAGFLRPTSGNVEVAGFNTEKNPSNSKGHIGYLPEGNPLFKDMEVYEYILFHARSKDVKNAEKKAAEVITKTLLKEKAGVKIEHLSKGYKQRVGLAAALISDPDVLLLDEPLSGLDPAQKIDIKNVIKEIAKDKALLLSTHILQEVAELCDKVLFLHNGDIIFDGKVEDLHKKREMIQIELQLNTSHEQAQKELQRLDEVSHIEVGKNLVINARDGSSIQEKIFDLAVRKNWKIIEMHEQEPSLEAIFRAMTK